VNTHRDAALHFPPCQSSRSEFYTTNAQSAKCHPTKPAAVLRRTGRHQEASTLLAHNICPTKTAIVSMIRMQNSLSFYGTYVWPARPEREFYDVQVALQSCSQSLKVSRKSRFSVLFSSLCCCPVCFASPLLLHALARLPSSNKTKSLLLFATETQIA
jgi:hypothetical protein